METNKIMECRFGSHLYGTSTENSDQDYKGIYLPTLREVANGMYAQQIKYNTGNDHTKNGPEDIDSEIYSIQKFLQLAFAGETVAIDMIHCPDNMLVVDSPEWQFIRANRSKFYTKNMKAYIGYCRTQAAKYGIKGSRLDDCQKVLEFLSQFEDWRKMSDIWEQLPTGSHIQKLVNEHVQNGADNRFYDVCGKSIQASVRVDYAKNIIQGYYDKYGHRAKQAQLNEGIDWKAVSHAFRAGYQLKHILTQGDLVYPLEEAAYILDIKIGKFHFINDGMAQKLDDLVNEIEQLSLVSTLPSQVDKEFWYSWVESLYNKKGKAYGAHGYILDGQSEKC